MHPSVLAIAAHPDDIEFVMAGTLLQLHRRGWQVHYFNVANGCCGSTTLNRQQCAAVRLDEARRAAELIPATFYPPICDDLEIFYNKELLAKVSAVVRQARPSIILTHAPSDYMEDHQNAARLAVGGAFSRAMPNWITCPESSIYADEVAVYHAQPHGNRDPLGNLVLPTYFVDVSPMMDRKRELLAAHASQDQWLDATQGISAYLETMLSLNNEVAQMMSSLEIPPPQRFEYAEGWRKHIHLGLGSADFDPLQKVLSESCHSTAG
jgi:N-acetylglucosamine malate deacetylase 1